MPKSLGKKLRGVLVFKDKRLLHSWTDALTRCHKINHLGRKIKGFVSRDKQLLIGWVS